MRTGTGDEAVTMGDLVLLEPEVEPVLGELEAGGFEIPAIHPPSRRSPPGETETWSELEGTQGRYEVGHPQ